jgi:hypothetical protein
LAQHLAHIWRNRAERRPRTLREGGLSGGRPSLYTPELAQAVLDRLSNGELLVEITDSDGMPSASTISLWKRTIDGFSQAYAHARQVQAQVVAERAVAKARQAKDAGLGRLAFDADRWLASRIDPANYGDKIQHTGDGGGPLQVEEIRRTIVDPKA